MEGARFARAALLSVGATAPGFLGLALGRLDAGIAGAFGAYLLVVSFPRLPARQPRAKLAVAAVSFGVSAAIGAFCGLDLWRLLPAAILFALWQARTELVPVSLRPVAALSALAMALSTAPLPPTLTSATYGLALGVGALWEALLVAVLVPRGETGRRRWRDELVLPWKGLLSREGPAPQEGRRVAARFDLVMAVLAAVGSVLVVLVPVPHSGWLLTTALRVMKPTRAETLTRMHRRGLGTVLGSVAAVAILSAGLPVGLHIGGMGAILCAMLLVGSQRYGLYSFCLTVVALNFAVSPSEPVAALGGYRVELTLGGLALGLLACLALPRAAAKG